MVSSLSPKTWVSRADGMNSNLNPETWEPGAPNPQGRGRWTVQLWVKRVTSPSCHLCFVRALSGLDDTSPQRGGPAAFLSSVILISSRNHRLPTPNPHFRETIISQLPGHYLAELNRLRKLTVTVRACLTDGCWTGNQEGKMDADLGRPRTRQDPQRLTETDISSCCLWHRCPAEAGAFLHGGEPTSLPWSQKS